MNVPLSQPAECVVKRPTLHILTKEQMSLMVRKDFFFSLSYHMLKLRAKYQGRHNTLVLFVQKKICLVPKSVTCLSVSLAVARYRMTSDKSGFGDICSSSEWVSYEQVHNEFEIPTHSRIPILTEEYGFRPAIGMT